MTAAYPPGSIANSSAMNSCPHGSGSNATSRPKRIDQFNIPDLAPFTDYVTDSLFPCVGAKSALNKGRIRFGQFGALGANSDIDRLCSELKSFSEEFADPGTTPVSYVAMFDSMDGLGRGQVSKRCCGANCSACTIVTVDRLHGMNR